MRAGDPYDPQDPELVAEREAAAALTRWYNGTTDDDDLRERLLRELFGGAGASPVVEPPVRCDYGSGVSVGDDFFANYGFVALDSAPVTVGDRCQFGPGVHVYTATHPLDAARRATGVETGEAVAVGDDVWVCGRAVLTPGVTVGARSTVAAGAVVVDDVPPDVLVAGNPAEVVRELDDG